MDLKKVDIKTYPTGDVIKLTLVTTYVSGMYFAFSNAPGGFGYSTFNIVAPAP